MSAFHQLQYFSRVCMLCATWKNSPLVLSLKPWTCVRKKTRNVQMRPHRARKEFGCISVLSLRFAPTLWHWLHFCVPSEPVLLILHLRGLPLVLDPASCSAKVGDQITTFCFSSSGLCNVWSFSENLWSLCPVHRSRSYWLTSMGEVERNHEQKELYVLLHVTCQLFGCSLQKTMIYEHAMEW